MGCCQLVGDLELNLPGCVTSVSVSSSTEIIDVCSPPRLGPTIGNISINGYASNIVYVGCPSQAGVSINWVRRYDCVNDILYLIHSGEGLSFTSGPLTDIHYVSINGSLGRTYPILNANSGSGPTGIYMKTDRTDGYGLTYSGDILTFNTSSPSGLVKSNFGVGEGDMYLQSFNLDAQPGQYPTVSYSFLFTITG